MATSEITHDEDGTALAVYLPGSVPPEVHEAVLAAQAAMHEEQAAQLDGAETLAAAEAKAQALRDATDAAEPFKLDARKHYYLRGVPRTYDHPADPPLVDVQYPDGATVEKAVLLPQPVQHKPRKNDHAGPYKLQVLREPTTISTPHGPATGLPGTVLATHVHTGDQHFVSPADTDQYEHDKG